RSSTPLVGPHTLVLPLQNGVEAPEHVARALSLEHALGGVAKIISFVSAPGQIEHAGAEPALVIGALDGQRSERLLELGHAFEAAKGVSVTLTDDIQLALW